MCQPASPFSSKPGLARPAGIWAGVVAAVRASITHSRDKRPAAMLHLFSPELSFVRAQDHAWLSTPVRKYDDVLPASPLSSVTTPPIASTPKSAATNYTNSTNLFREIRGEFLRGLSPGAPRETGGFT